MTVVPLRRNRDFVLLQSGQLLSSVGSESTAIAYPLLTLALTHSPAKAGLVAFRAAAGAQQARVAAVNIAAPPLGGALFGLGRAVPFLADAVSYTFSVASLLMMRTPFQQERATERVPLRARVVEGFQFL
jgi:hypothetical protein